MEERDKLEMRLAALTSGSNPNPSQMGEIISDYRQFLTGSHSCIIFTPEEANRWYNYSMEERREISDDGVLESAPNQETNKQFVLNSKSEPVKNNIKNFLDIAAARAREREHDLLQVQEESEPSPVEDAQLSATASGDLRKMPEGLTKIEQIRWRRLNKVYPAAAPGQSRPREAGAPEAMERESGGASAGMPGAQGGGLKKKKRRKSKRRKSKKKKSKTRRRRR